MPSVDVGLTITAINNASGAINNVGRDVKTLGENAQATSNRLKAIQVVIAGILIEKTFEWTKKLIAAAAATQNLDIRMAGFAGSAKTAHKIWDDLATTFAGTPVKMDTISQSWIKLRAVVSSNDKATEVIKSVGNAILAMGGGDENINQVASAFQRMFAAGSASSREYKSILQQTGITIGDLAKVAGKTSTALTYELSKGFLNASQFVDLFVKASNERFGFFAQNLKSSIGGAFNLISNTVTKGMADIGAKTDLNARVTTFFQNVAHAVDAWMASINQSKIDALWAFFAKVEPVIRNTIVAVYNLASGILGFGGAVAGLLSKMSPEMIEDGVIGYYLFGKRGFVALAGLNALGAKLNQFSGAKDPVAALQQHYMAGGDSQNMAGVKAAFVGFLGTLDLEGRALIKKVGGNLATALELGAKTKGQKFADSLLGSPADWAKKQKEIEELIKRMGQHSAGTQTNSTAPQLVDAMRAAAALTPLLNDQLQTTGDRIAEMIAKTDGDQLGQAFLSAKLQVDGIVKAIDSSIKSEASLKIHTGENLAIVAALKAKREEVLVQLDRELVKIQLINGMMREQLQIQQAGAQLQNRFAAIMLDINSNTSPMANIFQGLSGGQAALQTLQQQAQLLQQINTLDSQRKALEIQLQDVLKDGGSTKAINATIQSIDDLKQHTQTALDALTVEGQMTKQLWKDLATTMENDISNGLAGLIEGTMTLGDVMRQVFRDMISLGIKFLLQLVEIQLFGQIAQQASLAAMGPTAAAAQLMWAPAAMAASIATMGGADATGILAYQAAMATALVPFAKGGVPGLSDLSGSIMTGPTMFGVGGEAGNEAVMPLTRVGGKLGVRAEGGGGNHFHFHSADPESGVKFFMEHMHLIEAGLAQRGRLNKQ